MLKRRILCGLFASSLLLLVSLNHDFQTSPTHGQPVLVADGPEPPPPPPNGNNLLPDSNMFPA